MLVKYTMSEEEIKEACAQWMTEHGNHQFDAGDVEIKNLMTGYIAEATAED